MKGGFRQFENPEQRKHIERVRIPDSDAINWITQLREAGMSEEGVDKVMMHLSDTYVEKKLGGVIEDVTNYLQEQLKEESGIEINATKREKLRQIVLERLRYAESDDTVKIDFYGRDLPED